MSSLAHFAEIFKTEYCTIIFREFSADDDITFIETSSSFQWGGVAFHQAAVRSRSNPIVGL